MAVSAQVEADTGDVTLTLVCPRAAAKSLQVAILDTRSGRYLAPGGWANSRKTIAQAHATDGTVHIIIPASLAARVQPGTPCLLDEPFINLREPFIWPSPVSVPAPAASPPPAPDKRATPEQPREAPQPAATAIDLPVKQSSMAGVVGALFVGLLTGAVAGYQAGYKVSLPIQAPAASRDQNPSFPKVPPQLRDNPSPTTQDPGAANRPTARPPRTVWTGVAFSAEGNVYTAANQLTQEAGERLALAACQAENRPNPKDCHLYGAFTNECVSMARPRARHGNPRFWIGSHRGWWWAENEAILTCETATGTKDCVTIFTVCSPDDLSKPG